MKFPRNMSATVESLLKAIKECNLPTIQTCINQGINANKICIGGVTPLTAAVQGGNISVIKLLAESTTRKAKRRRCDNVHTSDNGNLRQHKNIGYFVVCHDADENEFGEGPTPDGMDALEWDLEASNPDSSEESPPEANIYKWCANILNKTSILLDSPDYDISRLDSHGQNVLHYAIRTGNTEIVDYLLTNYADININQCDVNWCSPLHIAAQHTDHHTDTTDLIRYLVASGADVNASNTNKQTPLHFAAHSGAFAAVRALVKHGACVNAFDLKDRSPLSLAVQCGREDIAEYLIGEGSKLNQEECFGDTVLYKAVRNKMCGTVQRLLDAGATIVQSHLLLHVAIRLHSLDMVRSLCRAGAIVNIRDNEGYTPLMTACTVQNVEIAEYLLDNGATVNAVNQINGLTALHLCVQLVFDAATFAQLLQLLVRHRVNVAACCYHGSPLFHALVRRNLGAAGALFRDGAIDVNYREPQVGFDCLSLVKKHGNLELVKLVLLDGFNFRNLTFDLKSLKSGDADLVYEYIVAAKGRPLSLRELCRVRIRRCIGVNVRRDVPVLPLPPVMRSYLMFDVL